jgi:uncharacterized protein YerC
MSVFKYSLVITATPKHLQFFENVCAILELDRSFLRLAVVELLLKKQGKSLMPSDSIGNTLSAFERKELVTLHN